MYVDANDPLPKNKYDISSNQVWSEHGNGKNNNQTDLIIKFDINRAFFVQVAVAVIESDTISFINADTTDRSRVLCFEELMFENKIIFTIQIS